MGVGLCPAVGLCPGVSVWGESLSGRGGSVQGGLCQGDPLPIR